MPNKTIHAGGIPFGDGLNLYSRYPLYNVVREPWEQAYGILDSSSDELTPKGFMCASMQIADGVYVDVYDLHADADDGEQDIAARVAQFQQLLAYVEDYSKDHAVLIIGDTNARFLQLPSRLKELFIDGAGFKEAWVEAENEGRYTVTPEDVERFTAEYPSWWGYWDSAEKIFYRDGGGVSLELASHEYVWHFDEEGNRLADHAAQIAEFTYTINRSAVQDSRRYKQERWRPIHMLRLYIKYFFKSLFLILSDLPRYLLEKIDRPS